MSCFKAYDIRGRVPDELDERLAHDIGRAFADLVGNEGAVVVGRDIRTSSPALRAAVTEGLLAGGCDVVDIGMGGTEEVYFHTFDRGAAGGIMVTASHNPIDYNGMKLVREGSRPISGDSGLRELEHAARAGVFASAARRGTVRADHDKSRYVEHLLGYVDRAVLKPLRIVVDAGNGGAGLVIDALEPHLPFEFVKLHHEPDGTFPNGIPNPLLPENRAATAAAVRAHRADFGVAWDGDFDRCFFFDGDGHFIEGYYLVGLLAEAVLERKPGRRIIHDPRLTWNTIERVERAGGTAIQSKTGHAFIKERMRAEDAAYGGEMSAHHYFADFAYCDSGMIPWLLVAERISRTGVPLGEMVAACQAAYPCSGEINFRVGDVRATIDAVVGAYAAEAPAIDRTDGVSVEFRDWRFNLRGSNTEPLLRLNVETRGDAALLDRRVAELRSRIHESAAAAAATAVGG